MSQCSPFHNRTPFCIHATLYTITYIKQKVNDLWCHPRLLPLFLALCDDKEKMYYAHYAAGQGFEPRLKASKASVLPLDDPAKTPVNYTTFVEKTNRSNPCTTDTPTALSHRMSYSTNAPSPYNKKSKTSNTNAFLIALLPCYSLLTRHQYDTLTNTHSSQIL